MKGRSWISISVMLLVAVMAAAIGWRYAQDIGAARARITSGSEIAQTKCGPVEYSVKGEGPPLLLVHGAGGGFDQGLGIAHELAAKGLKVIVMSRFGYLRTPLPPDASPGAQADAHACLLDTLSIGRASIAGVSAGAPSTLMFALRHPQRTAALVLIVPAGRAPGAANAASTPPATEFLFDTALRSDFLFWAAMNVARDTLIESILATPPAVVHAATADEQRRAASMLAQILPVSARRLGLLNDARIVAEPPGYPLERLTSPALVISLKDDGFGTWDNARYIVSRLPQARFLGFEQGGHVWIGHHEDVLREIAAFVHRLGALSRLEAPSQ